VKGAEGLGHRSVEYRALRCLVAHLFNYKQDDIIKYFDFKLGPIQLAAAKRDWVSISNNISLDVPVIYRRKFDTNTVDTFLIWVLDTFAVFYSWGVTIVKLWGKKYTIPKIALKIRPVLLYVLNR
jgi:hypothetical protein